MYLTRKEIKGTEEVHWYDITDYEGFHKGNRRNKSPMISFCYIDKSNVGDPTTKEFYQADIFDNWLKAKHHTNHISLVIWCLIRLWNVILFCTVDLGILRASRDVSLVQYNSSTNTTQVTTVDETYFTPCRGNFVTTQSLQRLILSLVLGQNILQMMFDVIEFLYGIAKRRYVWYKWTEKGKKKIAVQIKFYRVMQFCGEAGICVGTLTGLFYSITGKPLIESLLFLKMMYILISTGVTWSLLYFIQLNPWIGKMVVSIQLMVKDLIKFTAVYALFLVMFAHAFLRLVSEGTNETGNCSRYFSGILDSWYR